MPDHVTNNPLVRHKTIAESLADPEESAYWGALRMKMALRYMPPAGAPRAEYVQFDLPPVE